VITPRPLNLNEQHDHRLLIARWNKAGISFTDCKEYPQVSLQLVAEASLIAVTDKANRYLPERRGEVKMQDKGFTLRTAHLVKGSPAAARKLLKRKSIVEGGGRNRTDE
jgi:hypothetical protein